MKILYDHQMFSLQKFGGISRYFANLISYRPDEFDYSLPIRFSENYYLQKADIVPLKELPFITSFRLKRQFYYYYNQQVCKKAISKNNFDLFHPTYYNPYYLKGLKKPCIITLHDMIHEKFKDSFPVWDHTSEHKRLLATRADHIIVVSNNTKKDLIELWNIDENKISVVYHGCNENVSPAPRMFTDYILYVGDRKGYKNFIPFIKAITPLFNKYRELKVVCTGSVFSKEERILFEQLDISNRLIHTGANDSQLASLYKYATFFIFPSCYEGFGIPILEAWQNNCPICISNTSCFPEVAGDAALYFNPAREESIFYVVDKLLTDTTLANQLREKGKERLKQFSLRNTADQTYSIYHQYK